MNKIVVKNLVKNFESKKVLKDITLTIKEGESIVLLGASGCGKTVFIKILASLLDATEGSVKVDGKEITNLTEQQKEKYIAKLSFLFQLNALFDSLPVWKNICLAQIENEGLSKKNAIILAKKKLKDVGLDEDVAMLFPSDISGGMQKRVALARCLSSDPEIIFFDEPTSGLDPQTTARIANLIKSLKGTEGKKLTKISIMHDIEAAKVVADRFIFFHEGAVEWIGTLDEMKKSENQILQSFIKAL